MFELISATLKTLESKVNGLEEDLKRVTAERDALKEKVQEVYVVWVGSRCYGLYTGLSWAEKRFEYCCSRYPEQSVRLEGRVKLRDNGVNPEEDFWI